MAFIKLKLQEAGAVHNPTTEIVNTKYIIKITATKFGPVVYILDDGKKPTAYEVKNYSFEELEELLTIKKPFDPLA